jgi:hypothetical protein
MKHRILLPVIAVVAALSLGAGVAVAADDPPKQTSFVDAVAAKLGISPEKLREAVRAVISEQIDARVAAGKLDADRAARLKEALESFQQANGFRFGHGFGFGLWKHGKPFKARAWHGGWLAPIAGALGLTTEDLFAQLRSGKTLPEIAKAQGKSADDVKKAISDAAKARFDKAVENKRLTPEQAAKWLERTNAWINRLVDRIFATTS